ncbi:MAG: VWA domain-containing protein [Alphaproteobacteria bacterium]|nr:VWA domain-containing protein [Alphaproteobacteria bacterium]
MIDFFNNFHFLRPWFLLFLLIPLMLYAKKIKFSNKTSSWEDVCDKHLLDYLLVGNNKIKRKSLKSYIYIGLTVASIACAGPSWKKLEIPTFTIENPNMFVLSLAQDMQLTDVTPSRLDRAKYAILDIIDGVEQGQFGLEVYSQEPYVISPITDDVNLIKNIMPQIVPNIVPDNGDRLDRAIDLAIKRFVNAGYSSGNIILFTSDVGSRFDLALELVEKAKKLDYTVNVVDTSFLGNEKLPILAEKGNGVYTSIKNNDIKPILKKISDISEEKTKLSKNLRSNYVDFGYYLLIIPLMCVLVFFRRGILVLFFVLSFSSFAEASFFLNNDQEGLKYFNSKKYDEALSVFKNPLWRAITYYKQNKLEEALKEIGDKNDEYSLYNKGVFLTKLCKYEDAKQVFSDVVRLYPNNEDAKYNLDVLNELFLKAKDDPKVLECDNQQDNQQSNSNSNKNDSEEKEDKDNQNKDENKSDNKSDSQENKNNQSNKQENKEQSQDEQKNNSSDENKKEGDKEQQDKTDDNKEKNKSKSDENEGQNKSNNNTQENQNKSDSESSSNEEPESENKENDRNELASSANDDKKDGQAKEGDGKDDNSNEKKEKTEQEQTIQNMGVKKGKEDEEYDEEALIMQRKYREIPEDVGGLLREFIKKEYIKDRYRDESY